ncbi:MAG: hypothetical protein WD876_02295 [Candidatus Pacearchaeota archaeon]
MTVETVLQHWILTNFVYPFLLVFFIVFAVLEKTKILGGENKQLHAMVAFVIGLIFVAAVYPKLVLNEMILFLTISLIVVFVFMLLWGFVSGGELKLGENSMIKYGAGGLIFVVVAVALLSILGVWGDIYGFLFKQTWSRGFWTNAIFILAIAGAIAVVLKSTTKGK